MIEGLSSDSSEARKYGCRWTFRIDVRAEVKKLSERNPKAVRNLAELPAVEGQRAELHHLLLLDRSRALTSTPAPRRQQRDRGYDANGFASMLGAAVPETPRLSAQPEPTRPDRSFRPKPTPSAPDMALSGWPALGLLCLFPSRNQTFHASHALASTTRRQPQSQALSASPVQSLLHHPGEPRPCRNRNSDRWHGRSWSRAC